VTKQLLYYENVLPVSAERHKDWYIKAPGDYLFARASNSVPVMAVEFPAAAIDYAIVFAGNEDSIMPVTMLGIEKDVNLFIDDAGHWDSNYIPAFVRRYPFVFSKSEDGDKFFLCLDEDYSGINQDGRGERLFDSDGERTQYLGKVLNFVQEYQLQFNRTQLFCKKLQELDLLEPMHAQFSLPSGRKGALTGFQAVSRAKLKSLPGNQLEELIKTDELELIFTHLQSLRNFSGMVSKAGIEADRANSAGDAEEGQMQH